MTKGNKGKVLSWAQRRDHLCLAGPPAAITRADYSRPLNSEGVGSTQPPLCSQKSAAKPVLSKDQLYSDTGSDDLELPRKKLFEILPSPKAGKYIISIRNSQNKKCIKTLGPLGRWLPRNSLRVSVSEIGWSVVICSRGCSSIKRRV